MSSSSQSAENLVWEPALRRGAVLDVIRGARRELVLSVFRCDDFKILDALAEAVQRKVRVRALLTQRAKNWDKRLQDLGVFLDSMGAEVHRFSGAETKYHAKYIVADDGPALIASLNFTRKCFDRTCDFLLITRQPEVVLGLKQLFDGDCRTPGAGLPTGLDGPLIVGPERARERFREILGGARRTIRMIDHRLSDPEFVALLRSRQAAGVDVQVLGQGAVAGMLSHGKLMLVDDATAVIGSISLSPPALNRRREVAAVIRDPAHVGQLKRFFETHGTTRGNQGGGPGLNEWSVPDRIDPDDDDDSD
jgi:phosphatidylserine/phosphatidylglycerophosphate/cardiolipin synthase-like enzyme